MKSGRELGASAVTAHKRKTRTSNRRCSETAQFCACRPQFAAQARLKPADLAALRRRAEPTTPGFWADLARAHLHWHRPVHARRSMKRGAQYRWFTDGELNVSHNCLDVHLASAADKTRDHFRGRARRYAHAELSRAARAGVPLRQRAQGPGRAARRSRRHLHAAGARDRRRDAGLRAHRRDSLGRVRRLLAPVAARPHRRCRRQAGDHRRRWLARRTNRCRSRARPIRRLSQGCPTIEHVVVLRRTGAARRRCRPSAIAGGTNCIDGASPMCEPEWVDAEHPLYLLYTSGSTGKPKGIQHSSAGYLLNAQSSLRVGIRSARGRCLLVHGRCRLGDRAQLCGLRTAGGRRHDRHVRRRADLSGRRAASGRSARRTASPFSTPRRPPFAR